MLAGPAIGALEKRKSLKLLDSNQEVFHMRWASNEFLLQNELIIDNNFADIVIALLN